MPRMSAQTLAARAAEKLQQANETQQKIAEQALAAIENGIDPEVAVFIAEEAAKPTPLASPEDSGGRSKKIGTSVAMKFVFEGETFRAGTYHMFDHELGAFNLYTDNKGCFSVDEIYVDYLLGTKNFVRAE